MHAWESIQKVLDYIEDNIPQEHSPEKLAGVADLSPFYFQRLFTRLVKRPVGEYVKMRRLARACETLSDKNKRILDIDYIFGTWLPSHHLASQPFSAEKYYKDNPDLNKMEIWVIPVPLD